MSEADYLGDCQFGTVDEQRKKASGRCLGCGHAPSDHPNDASGCQVFRPNRKGEAVEHPAHYNAGGIEVWDAIHAWGLNFHRGNAVKYIARAAHKGKEIEDLEKARFYLDDEIARLKGEK